MYCLKQLHNRNNEANTNQRRETNISDHNVAPSNTIDTEFINVDTSVNDKHITLREYSLLSAENKDRVPREKDNLVIDTYHQLF